MLTGEQLMGLALTMAAIHISESDTVVLNEQHCKHALSGYSDRLGCLPIPAEGQDSHIDGENACRGQLSKSYCEEHL